MNPADCKTVLEKWHFMQPYWNQLKFLRYDYEYKYSNSDLKKLNDFELEVMKIEQILYNKELTTLSKEKEVKEEINEEINKEVTITIPLRLIKSIEFK